MGRQDSLVFAPRFSLAAQYLLFVSVEFGVLLILLAMYCISWRKRTDRCTSFFADTAFIATMFILLFCLKSSGFNVLSYRMLLPAQLLLGLYAVLQLEHIKHRKGVLKPVVITMLGLQLTGSAPEMIAMAKNHYDVRISTVRLPKAVVAINQTRALNDCISIPYASELNSAWRFNTLINNMFRQKNIDKRYFCIGTLDPNNLVYLNKKDSAMLRKACETAQSPGNPSPSKSSVTAAEKNY
jgi:hypothetical protein